MDGLRYFQQYFFPIVGQNSSRTVMYFVPTICCYQIVPDSLVSGPNWTSLMHSNACHLVCSIWSYVAVLHHDGPYVYRNIYDFCRVLKSDPV